MEKGDKKDGKWRRKLRLLMKGGRRQKWVKVERKVAGKKRTDSEKIRATEGETQGKEVTKRKKEGKDREERKVRRKLPPQSGMWR